MREQPSVGHLYPRGVGSRPGQSRRGNAPVPLLEKLSGDRGREMRRFGAAAWILPVRGFLLQEEEEDVDGINRESSWGGMLR